MRVRDDTGASAVEYALLLTAIAGVLVVILLAFGANVTSLFRDSCNKVGTKVSAGTC